MPQKSQTYRISKVIDAPLAFVYNWCTDFREDDGKLTGSRSKKKILEKTKSRVITTSSSMENGKLIGHVSIVNLLPPNAWHLDTAGNPREQETGDYKLTRVGANKTRLDMVFDVKYGAGAKVPSKEWWEEDSGKFWDKLIVALMKDYSK
jgi:carbon monoxide dehydrogenase subunit G